MALEKGERLGGMLVVAGARVHPLEPMSPTSLRCAVRLDHPTSRTWTEIFPTPGGRAPARFAFGDVHHPDGRRGRVAPSALRAAYEAAYRDLRARLARTSGDALLARCEALDPRRPPAWLFWLPGGLALALFALAMLLLASRPRLALVAALLGAGSLLVAALPVLGGASFGTQELQRLLTALKPLRVLLSGEHGDDRHTAGLFVLYAPVARAAGTVEALRIQGFVVLGGALLLWVALRFRAAPGECLVGLALGVHPVLLKNCLEVGPYAFFTAFALLLHLAVGTTAEVSRRRFALGVVLQVSLSAVNQVGAVLAPCLLWLSVRRSRPALPVREALVRAGVVLAVALPFWLLAAGALGAEPSLRAAADRTPELAWGNRALWDLGRGLFRSALHGQTLVVVAAVVLLVGALTWRTRWDGLVLVGLALGILAALFSLAGTLRVQPYYGLYAVPPLFFGLSRLVGGLVAPVSRPLLGLVVLAALLMDLVSAGPALARQEASPPPAERVARVARSAAGRCPVLASATNDLVLPLVPHLADLRSLPSKTSQTGPGGPAGRREPAGVLWRVAGLSLTTFWSRHQLPHRFADRYLAKLVALSRLGCVQVLYDRDFPLPRIFGLLEARCTRAADHGALVLYRCGVPLDG